MTLDCKPSLGVSLACLRSGGDTGIGDIGNLKPLVEIAGLLGLDKVTVSQVYDTAEGFPIYPVYIDLRALGHLANRNREADYLARAGELEQLSEIDYIKVYNVKMHFLHEKFLQDGAATLSSDGYHAWWRASRKWLEPYSVYCTLRHKYGTGNNRFWSEPDYVRLLNDSHFIKEYSGDLQFHCYVQYLLHTQLEDVRSYAKERGIELVITPDTKDEGQEPALPQWWSALGREGRQEIYSSLNLPGEAPEALEPWVAEAELRRRLKEGPATVALRDLLAVTALDGSTSARMDITLESIMGHKALLGQIRRIIESPEE